MEPMRLIDTVERLLAQYRHDFRSTKSPQEIYQQQVQHLNASIDNLWKELYEDPSPDRVSQIRVRIVGHGGDLKELEIKHQASVNQNQEIYDQSVQELTMRLYKDMLTTIGLPIVGSLIQELRGGGRRDDVTSGSGSPIEIDSDRVHTVSVERSEPENSRTPASFNDTEGIESSTAVRISIGMCQSTVLMNYEERKKPRARSWPRKKTFPN